MKKKSGAKFLEILNSKPAIGALIFIILSLVSVLAGNVIVKEGDSYFDGNVGIGTTSPQEKLHVVGGAIINGSLVTIDGGASNYAKIKLASDSSGRGISDGFDIILDTIGFKFIGRENLPMIFYTNNTERIRILSEGKIGIGTTNPGSMLNVKNIASANDVLLLEDSSGICEAQPTTSGLTWSCSSDEKLKKDIAPSTFKALDYILSIPIFDYTVIKTDERVVGWTAQEMQKAGYEELVSEYYDNELNESVLSVSEIPQPILIKAIQEQQTQINQMRATLCKLGQLEYC